MCSRQLCACIRGLGRMEGPWLLVRLLQRQRCGVHLPSKGRSKLRLSSTSKSPPKTSCSEASVFISSSVHFILLPSPVLVLPIVTFPEKGLGGRRDGEGGGALQRERGSMIRQSSAVRPSVRPPTCTRDGLSSRDLTARSVDDYQAAHFPKARVCSPV